MTDATQIPSPAAAGHGFSRSRSLHNRAARIVNNLVVAGCYGAALLTMLALFLIFGYIVFRGASSLNWSLFTELPGPPNAGRPTGLRNAIAGTLSLIAMASCIGVPLGMLCGIYLAEYARDNWFSHGIRLVVDVLAGVPSIIVGVLGYEMIVVAWHPLAYDHSALVNALVWVVNQIIAVRTAVFPAGFSAWAGMIALGFMMCPVIARTTEEMLKLVPKALREASTGLGASKFQTLVRVVIPAASAGIITGVMLAVARVAGETAPLLFTVLGSNQPVFGKTDSFPYIMDLNHPFPSLTVKIYEYAGSAEEDWNRQAWAGMLILITMVLVLNITVRVISNRKRLGKA
jgi:phosphate transport system permease protein